MHTPCNDPSNDRKLNSNTRFEPIRLAQTKNGITKYSVIEYSYQVDDNIALWEESCEIKLPNKSFVSCQKASDDPVTSVKQYTFPDGSSIYVGFIFEGRIFYVYNQDGYQDKQNTPTTGLEITGNLGVLDMANSHFSFQPGQGQKVVTISAKNMESDAIAKWIKDSNNGGVNRPTSLEFQTTLNKVNKIKYMPNTKLIVNDVTSFSGSTVIIDAYGASYGTPTTAPYYNVSLGDELPSNPLPALP